MTNKMLLYFNIFFVNLCLLKIANAVDVSATQQLQQTLDNINSAAISDTKNVAVLLQIAQLALQLVPKQHKVCNMKWEKGENGCPVVQCKSGFALIGYQCYHIITKHQTWQDALKHCKGLGATLAQPMDGEENKLLSDYIRLHHPIIPEVSSQIWLGATDIKSVGTWLWATSNTKIQYSNWAPGEPNSKAENCATYAMYSGSIKWNNAPCDYKFRAACQQ